MGLQSTENSVVLSRSAGRSPQEHYTFNIPSGGAGGAASTAPPNAASAAAPQSARGPHSPLSTNSGSSSAASSTSASTASGAAAAGRANLQPQARGGSRSTAPPPDGIEEVDEEDVFDDPDADADNDAENENDEAGAISGEAFDVLYSYSHCTTHSLHRSPSRHSRTRVQYRTVYLSAQYART